MIIMDRNTSPISPLSEEAMVDVLSKTKINEYPGAEIDHFKQLYADHYNISPDYIEVANGSDEWIQKTIMTLGQNGVMTVAPDFVMYKEYADQIDVKFNTVPCNTDYRFDFDEVLKRIDEERPSLFLISMPHNPTGQLFDYEELEKLAGAMKSIGGHLVIDEAYAEFGPEFDKPAGEHVLIIRTLSKMYGVAGLRVGVVIAEGETFEKVTRINHPYPVNSLSLNMASKIFEEKEALAEFVAYQKRSKEMLETAFKAVSEKVNVMESYTNFVFTYGKEAVSLGTYLMGNGFRCRMYNDDSLKDVVRYSIIRHEDYDGLNKLIKEWSNQHV
ncbi:pyridoxal phosphate-dependent aminotransferase [Lacicoccus alkaliphilus]|uniref:Histidinol-phosphate aminotransferase n=1 Tax=Lacicoccus alkaliphilus DSM 16010 TaxID=1123231 RepID=A0A1M7DWH1_9BACL|nr:histidinol-phosphate transaminase [Salinicoccus alkaliphilus]SHL83852.1 histidinol-phosphate aminotransferase [Salinicoccus alkaliphilus DSM 16010]